MKLACLFLGAAVGLYAQALLAPPAGVLVDAHGRIAMLYGVSGNLLPPQFADAPAELRGQAILAAAFNPKGSVFKTEAQLLVFAAAAGTLGSLVSSQPAPHGPALFSFSADGSPAWVFYPSDSQLVNLTTGASLDGSGFGDAVAALGPTGTSSVLLLTRNGQQLSSASVSIPDGAYRQMSAIAGGEPGAYFQGGWLTTSSTGLLWTSATDQTAAIPIALPEPARTIQTIAAGAVAINEQWLLNARFQLLEIPQAPRRPVRIQP